MPTPIKTIAIFPKIQPDTVAAVFLLKKYGETAFPGVSKAEVVFWTSTPPGKTAEEYEKEGTLLIDMAGSRFDHHRDDHGKKTECASSLVAKFLGIDGKPELRKLLTYAKRDDLEGKGTISTDPLDRAFGLSGIIMNLNRIHGDNPRAILDFVNGVYEAHVYEEWRRAVELPAEWKQLKAEGKAQERVITVEGALPVRLISLESANVALPGFLRAYLKTDIVVQRLLTGHTNVVTHQKRRFDLREIVARIRTQEASRKGMPLPDDAALLRKPGRWDPTPEWFYDTAANTIQNGGVNPQDTPVTQLSLNEIIACVEDGLRASGAKEEAPK